jgi:hypothetical protein
VGKRKLLDFNGRKRKHWLPISIPTTKIIDLDVNGFYSTRIVPLKCCFTLKLLEIVDLTS